MFPTMFAALISDNPNPLAEMLVTFIEDGKRALSRVPSVSKDALDVLPDAEMPDKYAPFPYKYPLTDTFPWNVGLSDKTTFPVPVCVVVPVPPYVTANTPEVMLDAFENPVVTMPVNNEPFPRRYCPDTFPLMVMSLGSLVVDKVP